MGQTATITSTEVIEKKRTKPSHTSDDLWKVIAHNDDKTTMEFVVRILVQIFKKPLIIAEAIMWQVHNEGLSVVDTLPKAEAESRARRAMLAARLEGFPFQLTIEPKD